MFLGDLIKQYITINKLSLREFASRCGLSHTYISALEKNIDSRTGKPIAPTLDTVKYVAKGMNTSIEEILKILDEEQEFVVNQDLPSTHKNNSSSNSAVVFVYGTIPAGIPMECIEDIIDTEEIPVEMNQRTTGVSSISPLKSISYMLKVILSLIIVGIRRR